LYGYCEEDDEDDLPAGSTACYQIWARDSFVVGMYVVSEGSPEETLAELETSRSPSCRWCCSASPTASLRSTR
jgi:hypothetical protein